MTKRPAVLAILAVLWPLPAPAETLALSAERVLEIVQAVPAFRASELLPHDDPKTRALVVASAPKGDPDVAIELYGERGDLEAVVMLIKSKRADAGAAAALGRLIGAVMPQFPPPPAAAARTADAAEAAGDLRWAMQFEAETRRRLDQGEASLIVRRAGGRAMMIVWDDGAEMLRVTFVAGSGPAVADWAGAPAPRNSEVARALAATAEGRYDAALETLRKLAGAGDAEGQAWLADALMAGRGTPPARLAAAETRREIEVLVESASAKGDPHGQYLHGRLRRMANQGADQSDVIAWYRRAAAQGHADAVGALGLTLPQGTREQQEDVADWQEFGARLGNWNAMIGISGSYRVGEGRQMDPRLAYFWARVFETRYPVLPGADPEAARVISGRAGAELDDAAKAAVEAEVARWKPVGFAELLRECGRIRCPKSLRR